MSRALLIGLILAPCFLQASDFGAAISAAYQAIKPKLTATPVRESPKSQPPASSNPREATGFPAPSGTRPLPTPQKPDGPADPNQLLVRSADKFSRSGDRVIASGNVRFSFKGYDVTADRVDGNVQTEIFLLSGHVLVVGAEQVVRGEEVVVDFKAKAFRFIEGGGQFGPSMSQGNLIGDLFIKGQEGAGNENEQVFEDCTITTCTDDPPHFYFHARRANVRPDKRAVLRDVSIHVLGRKILNIPYLVIPLEKYSDRYTPEVGRSDDEGYYIKTSIFTPLKGSSFIKNHVDYYTKLGFGLGQDYHYFGQNIQGVFRYYGITNKPNSFITAINHRQYIWNGQLTVDATYQKNNYLTSPGTTQSNARLQYLFPQGQSNTRFTYFRSSNRSNSFEFIQDNMGISDQRVWSNSLTSQLDLNLVTAQSNRTVGDSTKRSELDVSFRASKEFPKLSADLEYIRNIPIESPDEFFSGADRTPFITLKSTSLKLFGQKLSTALPMRFQFQFGELQESQEVGRITRYFSDIDLNKPIPIGKRQNINVSSRYRQGMYSDGTAGYALNFNFDYRYTIQQDTSFNLRYMYLRPYGFSPLQIDQYGRSHNYTADISYRPIRSLLLSAQTGFDVLQLDRRETPWQTVGVTGTWQPNNRFQLRGYTNYDTFQHVWSNVRLDMGWYTSQGLVSIGTRYDGQRHTWGAINVFADGIVWKKLKTSAILAYNGYTKRFDSQQVSFTYDLHCAELIFQVINNPVGFRSGTQYGLYLRLKAMPFTTPFGIGTRGQAVGSGLGF